MVPRPISWLLTLTVVVGLARPATAWNDTGHRVVALIAYQALDDATRKKVQDILAHHPHYHDYLAKNIPPTADRHEWIAMKAATWPDWIRSGPREIKDYHRGTWHYVNKPFIVVDAADTETRAQIEALFRDPNRNTGDILKVIPECQRIVKAPASTAQEKAERAVRLCWLFHLVGDLHQPLHAVALCNKQLPTGDRGGNSLHVLPRGASTPSNLHAFWDNLLGNFEAPDAIQGLARLVQMRAALTDEERKGADPEKWANESLELAKGKAYTFNGKLIDFVIDATPPGPATAPALPDGYEKEAVAVARKRVVQAGYRLANLLQGTLSH